MKNPEIKLENRKLMVTLSDDALLERGKEQAQALLKIGELTLAAAKISAQKKPIEQRIADLCRIIESGEESQELECRWSYDWDGGLKTLFRPDTGEAVGDPIVIADWEKQEHLNFEKKGGK
jgi:hypothetical protein